MLPHLIGLAFGPISPCSVTVQVLAMMGGGITRSSVRTDCDTFAAEHASKLAPPHPAGLFFRQ
jgi:hypothetical protein